MVSGSLKLKPSLFPRKDNKTDMFISSLSYCINSINSQQCNKPILNATGKLRRISRSSIRATTLVVKGSVGFGLICAKNIQLLT